MLTYIFKFWSDKGCVGYILMWVGHVFRFVLMTHSVCCAFLATELHCAVQFKVFDIEHI